MRAVTGVAGHDRTIAIAPRPYVEAAIQTQVVVILILLIGVLVARRGNVVVEQRGRNALIPQLNRHAATRQLIEVHLRNRHINALSTRVVGYP
ncbi:hypothetical protein LMG33810_002892 [Carnimonas sp. LMG 33810]